MNKKVARGMSRAAPVLLKKLMVDKLRARLWLVKYWLVIVGII
ncbi:MAG: hypothetical protein WCT01_00450 [Candidatus Shapirobacteria bacterium]